MKSWLVSNGLTILLVVLPIVLPNRVLYRWVRKTIGKLISIITIKAESRGLAGLVAWVLNSVATICSAISDEVRGVPPAEADGVPAGEKVRKLGGNS